MHREMRAVGPDWVLRDMAGRLEVHCWVILVVLDPRAIGRLSVRIAERSLDAIAAAFLLLLCAPVAFVIAVIVATDGGPVFFVSREIGRKGLPCSLLSFRTTFIDADELLAEYYHYNPDAAAEWLHTQTLEFDPRVTPVGRLLRRFRLHQVPRLFNVIRGECTLFPAR
jgi:exopolysaccharide production protein ExoY